MKNIKGFTLAEVLMSKRVSRKECLHLFSRTSEPKEPLNNAKKLAAFTLAEVLITLAIIGVVTALTIPTLIINNRKATAVAQLKKNYNTFSNGFKASMAQQGVFQLSDTAIWTNIPEGNINHNSYWYSTNSAFKNAFERAFKVIGKGESIQYKYFNGNDSASYSTAVVLADGTYIYFWFYKNGGVSSHADEIKEKTHYIKNIGHIYFDVNGKKLPNQWGRDMFSFAIGSDGVLYPSQGYDEYLYDHGNTGSYDIKTNASCYSSSASGLGCAARIMNEGWEMNY